MQSMGTVRAMRGQVPAISRAAVRFLRIHNWSKGADAAPSHPSYNHSLQPSHDWNRCTPTTMGAKTCLRARVKDQAGNRPA